MAWQPKTSRSIRRRPPVIPLPPTRVQLAPSDATAASFTFAGAKLRNLQLHRDQQWRHRLVTGTGTITSATQQVKGVNVSSLSGGTLIYTVTLTDPAGNAGTRRYGHRRLR